MLIANTKTSFLAGRNSWITPNVFRQRKLPSHFAVVQRNRNHYSVTYPATA